MKVTVRYFGRLRELLATKKEEYELPEETSLMDLLVKVIPERHKEVSETWIKTIFRTVKNEILENKNGKPILKDYQILIGGRSFSLDYTLKDGDEVAVLPPFGGG